MGGLFDSDLIPLLFVLVMLANVFLDRRNRRRRRQQEQQTKAQGGLSGFHGDSSSLVSLYTDGAGGQKISGRT